MDLISVEHVNKAFGETKAVKDLTLSIAQGEIYGLVGADGAGKTTTLRLLVGALKADSGKIWVNGYDIESNVEHVRSQIGYLSQRFSLYEDLTILENIRFFAEIRGLTRKMWLPRCLEILDFVGLFEFKDRPAGQLSGGMKQKLGLATALVTRPEVLLLDEPTTGVDPVTRQDFWQLIIKLVAENQLNSGFQKRQEQTRKAVILTTPYMDEASRCHRIGFMRQGKIIVEGTPSALRNTLEGRILEIRQVDLPDMRKITRNLEAVEDVRHFGDRLHLRVKHGQLETVIHALSGIAKNKDGITMEVKQISPSLEDVFIAFSEHNDMTV